MDAARIEAEVKPFVYGEDGAVGKHGAETVIIVGLKSVPHLNGTVGFLEGPPDVFGTGRMHVRTYADVSPTYESPSEENAIHEGKLIGLKARRAPTHKQNTLLALSFF